jgi:mono/diheme cytochrome c family protein
VRGAGAVGLLLAALLVAACGGGADGDERASLTGAELFQENCAACHGADAEGAVGPSLVGVADRLSVDQTVAVVTDGRGVMPSFEGRLSESEIRRVVEYVRTR